MYHGNRGEVFVLCGQRKIEQEVPGGVAKTMDSDQFTETHPGEGQGPHCTATLGDRLIPQ